MDLSAIHENYWKQLFQHIILPDHSSSIAIKTMLSAISVF